MAFFLARQRASFLLARRSALAIRYPIRCRLYCTRSPVRASNVDSVGLSCPMNNVHALFDEDRHKRIALRIFSDAMSPFSQNPKCFLPPTCIVSYHPAPRLPGQFRRGILCFGARFASLWAHPLPMLTLSQPLADSSFHFARNRVACLFWFFRNSWLATRLEISPRRCLYPLSLPYAALLRL